MIVALLALLAACTHSSSVTHQPPAQASSDTPVQPAESGRVTRANLTSTITVVAEGLLGPIGMAELANGSLLVAEEGTGARDDSAGVSLITPDGTVGRFISGFSSTRDAGDLAGVPLVALSPDGATLYVGNFGTGHLWTYALNADEQIDGIELPATPLAPDDLGVAMQRLNNVMLVNPFDITFDAAGVPVVSDASGNGVAKENPTGTTRFIHRFDQLPNPARATDMIEAVPTGIVRMGDEYWVTLTGGCPYPAGGGQLVAIDEERNQRTLLEGLNMPIDVALGTDGSVWVLEFARFKAGEDCFSGTGYQSETGRLSRLHEDGTLETVLDQLNFPGAVLPAADGSLYISEVLSGRILRVTFDDSAADVRMARPAAASSGLDNHAVPVSPEPEPATQAFFVDRAQSIGLTFTHGAFREGVTADPVAAMGGGLCWIDFDNDGWLDLYVVNSWSQADVHDASHVSQADVHDTSHALRAGLYQMKQPHNALFHNDGGVFIDVSTTSGADLSMRGNGCIAADFNNDGFDDLYVTAYGANALLWNQGNGTFVDGAVAAGVEAPQWSSAAAAGDLNGDGLLDLFVGSYIDLSHTIPKPSGAFPQDYYGIPDRLFLNQGQDSSGYATFREITQEAGLLHEERTLGALFSDLDNDGDLDLYIANDGHRNRLYLNAPLFEKNAAVHAPLLDKDADAHAPLLDRDEEVNGSRRNSRLGFQLVDSTAEADVGDSGSGMGIAGGDYDGDGRIDLFVTNWERELNALYRNLGNEAGVLAFQYSTYRIGISGLGNNMTGWGAHLADFDHDTDVDLLVVNGRVPVTNLETDGQLVHYYRNRTVAPGQSEGRSGQFLEWTEQVGLEELGPLMGRGSAMADYDNDGDLDVAINQIAGDLILLANEAADYAHWLIIDPGVVMPGLRAVITLADGRKLVREVHIGSSYLASEDPRLHFGLGAATRVERLQVSWPGGERATLQHVAADQILRLKP